ncbi:MAG TPA: oligosaccharide flippase family protein [Candidatus Eisenbacteria bacterium]|nr:oligosaccharide flippase family protein [Candidatus Eisenbacteria bacterium]
MKNQVLRNILSNYGVNLAAMALGFLVVPFLIGKLGKEAFGLIVLAESMIGFFEIGTISVRVALSRHAAFALAQGDSKGFVEYLSTGRCLLFGSAAFVLTAGLAMSLNFPRIFNVPAVFASDSRALFSLIVLAFSMTVPNIVFWSALYAKERFDLLNLSMSLGLILRAVALFVCYSVLPERYLSLGTYGVIYLAMVWTQNLLVWFWHRRVFPDMKLGWRHFTRGKVREILSMSMHTSLARVSNLLYDNTANFIINILWGPAFNTMYSVSLKVPQLMKRLFTDTSWTLTPTFTALAAQGRKEAFRRLLFLYTKVVAAITTPICFVLIFFGAPLIRMWVGPGFDAASRLLWFHVIPLFVSVPFSVCGCITNAYAKVKLPSRVAFAIAVANVALGLGLGWGLGWKLTGIAVASSISISIYSVIYVPYYACRVGDIPYLRYWVDGFLRVFLLAGACFALPFFWIRSGYFHGAWSWLAVGTLAAAYLPGIYSFVLSPREKLQLQELLRGFMPPLQRLMPEEPVFVAQRTVKQESSR